MHPREMIVPFVRAEVTFADDPLCRTALAVWVAGCSRQCPECQNPQLRDVSAGVEMTSVSVGVLVFNEVIVNQKDLIKSVVFVGGDWALYPEQYVYLAEWARSEYNLETVLYTGELFEDLPEIMKNQSDWIIDGEWRVEERSVFPASRNQRVFHNNEQVDPETLPLHKHLQSAET